MLVDNEPGVLARVIGLFSGRGYNIDSLTVSETEHEKHLSRITIVTRGTPMVLEQIKNQLDRLVPVHRVVDLTTAGPAIQRELAMVKVRGNGEQRMEALRLADAFRARVIDATTESFVFEITGASDKIESFINLMLPLGLVEVSRTGVVAIARGPEGMYRRIPRAGLDAARALCSPRQLRFDQVGEAVDEALQEFLRALVADIALIVEQVRLELDVGFAAEQRHAEAEHDGAQIGLHQRGADRAGRSAGDEAGLAGPDAGAERPRAPVDGVFQRGRDRAVMFRRDDQHAVGLFDLVLEAHHLGRQIAFVVLVVQRQIVDAHEFGVEFAGAELDQRLGEFAVDRFAAVRADDDGDLREGHG